MGDYSSQRATALKLLKKFGKVITVSRSVAGEYDPATGTTSDTEETATGYGVLLKFSNSEVDGTTILSSDRKLLYTGEELKINDKYVNERIVSVSPLDPDESGAIIYTCGLRK